MSTFRDHAMRILRYQEAPLPVVHFGFWHETLARWAAEGHITAEEARGWGDGNPVDWSITRKMGFDFNWYNCVHPHLGHMPGFESKVLEVLPDGSRKVVNHDGVIVLDIPGSKGIPAEFDHLLKDRASWEEHFKPRLQYDPSRISGAWVTVQGVSKPWDQGGRDMLADPAGRQTPLGIHCGSYLGYLRNCIGVEGLAYLPSDDEDLFREMVDTICGLSYRVLSEMLATGVVFDFAHFWEDICFKNGPLINPALFREVVGPHYHRTTALLARHGLDIISLDCDGLIDDLVPVWLENGVNTMFPIEVGTWDASIAPWRARYGRTLRGVGGMNKVVFARDRAAVDREVERLKPLVELGGYIPCPDHRIPPDAEWDTVRYYADRMRRVFG